MAGDGKKLREVLLYYWKHEVMKTWPLLSPCFYEGEKCFTFPPAWLVGASPNVCGLLGSQVPLSLFRRPGSVGMVFRYGTGSVQAKLESRCSLKYCLPYLCYFPCCHDNMPIKSNCREKGLTLAHGVQDSMVEKMWRQMCEGPVHFVSTVRKQRAMNDGAQLTFSF